MTTNVVVLSNHRTAWSEHAEAICSAWCGGVESILETGRQLLRAKKELQHGLWLDMVKQALPFSEDTAERLMRISQHPVFLNSALVRNLPPSWSILYEITQMEHETVKAKIEDGTINPTISKRAAASLRKGISKSESADPVSTDTIKGDMKKPGPRIKPHEGLSVSETCRELISNDPQSAQQARNPRAPIARRLSPSQLNH